MIWYPALLVFIAAACIMFARCERIKSWRGSPRTTKTDQAFLWQYEVSGRGRRPLASRMGISASIPFMFAVEEERWPHRLSKWFGFCEEFQTEDNEFDRRVFIISDDKLFQQKLHNNLELHQLIVKAFSHGARKIYSTPGHLIIHLKETREQPPEDMADILTTLLYDIRKHLSGAVVPVQESDTSLPVKLAVSKALSPFLLITALATALINLAMGFTIMDWWQMWPLLEHYSAAVVLITLISIYVAFRNSSYGHEVLMRFLRIGIWSVVLACVMILWFVNCQYDGSEMQVYTEPALEKRATRSKRSMRYRIRTINWHHPNETLMVDVPHALYTRIRVGDRIRIFTRAGYFGMEWIVKVE